MRKLPIFAPFIVLLLILPFFSCKSAPATPAPAPREETPSPASPVDPSLLGDLSAARARADDARKKAADFNSSAYFPSEWEAADAQYARGRQAPQNTEAGVRDGIAAYNAAADAYDSVFELTIPLYAQAREDEIIALRDKLIAGGWLGLFPGHMVAADKVALAAYDQYEAKDYYAAKDTADQALMMFQTQSNAFDAWLVRREIEERGFVSYDPDNYARADEILNDALDNYETENYALAYENAQEALNKYNLVLSAGWAAHADEYAARASDARQEALDAKANIAVKDVFSQADANYNAATSAMDAQKYGDAARQFAAAETQFLAAAQSAIEKRNIAALTIEEANRKIEESDETARLAELILEGGAE